MDNLTEQEIIRREKLSFLKENNIDPFGSKFNVTITSIEMLEKYNEMEKEAIHELDLDVSYAGRIMTKREKGKAGFAHIQDRDGQLQIYVRADMVSELEYEVFTKGDLGDIVGVEGKLFKTNMGELSIKVTKYTHLVKALKPLPEKFHGLVDVEERSRKRYVDLIMNEKSRNTAFTRPKIYKYIRNYLDNLNYIEVETPALNSILGGTSALPFVTHFNALHMDMYLRIATELPLKKLLVGGMDAVYEIGRLFRNEGVDSTHNPEFTSIELYKAYADLSDMMDLTEDLIRKLILEIRKETVIEYNGVTIDFEKPFERINMVEAVENATGINFYNVSDIEEARRYAKEHDIKVEKHFGIGHIVSEFFEKYIEETLINPTFVCKHPIEITPLAKKDDSDERYTQRFELFINKTEYANAYTELNDPIDQLERFESQLKERELGNDEANEIDYEFVDALSYGMPPAGGLGIGLDRLTMLLTNESNIREVILFPHMKNKN